jgi:hypothetical protein
LYYYSNPAPVDFSTFPSNVYPGEKCNITKSSYLS